MENTDLRYHYLFAGDKCALAHATPDDEMLELYAQIEYPQRNTYTHDRLLDDSQFGQLLWQIAKAAMLDGNAHGLLSRQPDSPNVIVYTLAAHNNRLDVIVRQALYDAGLL